MKHKGKYLAIKLTAEQKEQHDSAAPPSGEENVWSGEADWTNGINPGRASSRLSKVSQTSPVPPGSSEAFPVQMGCLIPPVCFGSVLSLIPVGFIQKNLHREKFWSDGQNLSLDGFFQQEA